MKIDAPNPLKSARAAARLASKSSIFGGLGKMYEELEKEGLALETAEKEKEVVKKLATLGGGAKRLASLLFVSLFYRPVAASSSLMLKKLSKTILAGKKKPVKS